MNLNPILLVENNESDVALTMRALQKKQITNRLIVFEEGEGILKYLFQDQRSESDVNRLNMQPALVLLDINLPGIDGLSVLKRIRADDRTRRLLVVVLTSSTEEQDLANAYDFGANSYIRKPVNFSQFEDAVEKLSHYWLALNEAPPKVNLI